MFWRSTRHTQGVVHKRTKGKQGEREAAAMWRHHGWGAACPSPGSGGMRPYGAGDLSPWPGDLHGVSPWLVEVKRDEKLAATSRTFQGHGFVRGVLRSLAALWIRHAGVVGGARPLPVMMGRSNFDAWRFFVPVWLLEEWLGTKMPSGSEEWVELEESEFFSLAEAIQPPMQGQGGTRWTHAQSHQRSGTI